MSGSDKQTSPVRLLSTVAQIYVAELLEAKRPIAAMEFMRNLIKIHKQRLDFEERFIESRIATQQMTLYQILKQHGGNPTERWDLIKDLKSRVEQISPDAWEDNALRSLRDERAQILQYHASEEGNQYKDPQLRSEVLPRLIASHEEVLQLESGLATPTAEQARSRSLRAICELKEEQGSVADYRVYAQELHKAALREFRAAEKTQTTTITVAYDMLSSHVILCKAYSRVKKWEEVVSIATNGIEICRTIGWDNEVRPHVELCQLLVYRCRGYLNTQQPRSSLDDARDAVREANSIPWDEVHPNQDIQAEYPNQYQKYRWQNFAQLNLIDTLYNRQVIEPDEQFGLVQALHGLQTFVSDTNPRPEQQYYETQYRAKKIRALMRLERWQDALANCRTLVDKSVQLLSSSDASQVMGTVDQLVKSCEDAADCLEKMDKKKLADRLLDEADELAEYAETETRLDSYFERGQRLQKTLETIYEEAILTAQQIVVEAMQIGTFKNVNRLPR